MLDGILSGKANLFFRTFLEMYRESDFSTKGSYTRKRKRPMVGSTIAEAARTLVKTMWDHHGRRPFYHPESSSKSGFSTNVQNLIKAMISVSPSPKSQKAITPALLRCMAQHTSGSVKNNEEDHMADLIIGAFFCHALLQICQPERSRKNHHHSSWRNQFLQQLAERNKSQSSQSTQCRNSCEDPVRGPEK